MTRRWLGGFGFPVLGLLILLNACSILPKGDPDVDAHRKALGFASWYGPSFDGRATASGERYAMVALTAAHRTLPFGTMLLVTNLDNKRQVRVRINDRGPYVHGRILDVSFAAAQELEMVRRGTSRISLMVVKPDASDDATPEVMSKTTVFPSISFAVRFGQTNPVYTSSGPSVLLIRNPGADFLRAGSLGEVWQRRARRYAAVLETESPV